MDSWLQWVWVGVLSLFPVCFSCFLAEVPFLDHRDPLSRILEDFRRGLLPYVWGGKVTLATGLAFEPFSPLGFAFAFLFRGFVRILASFLVRVTKYCATPVGAVLLLVLRFVVALFTTCKWWSLLWVYDYVCVCPCTNFGAACSAYSPDRLCWLKSRAPWGR